MTQLIIDGVQLPESRNGGYVIQKEQLGTDVVMISGRIVRESRGSVWRIKYQYGYFKPDQMNEVIAACEKGRKEPILCGYLPQDSTGALSYGNFVVTKFNRPRFFWSRQGNPMWGDFSVELREEKPSD